MNLIVLGLIFDFIGVGILIFTTLFIGGHTRHEQEKWTSRKRYFWVGWTLDFRKSFPRLRQTSKLGIIPPKNLGNVIGFIFIGLGFLLQIIGNLKLLPT
ncbi:MAG: hypothetical protein KKF56_04935 [Nanoarchaeota archaeon]|nr:hypothetical protein [Nanoarchaeota archaeon]